MPTQITMNITLCDYCITYYDEDMKYCCGNYCNECVKEKQEDQKLCPECNSIMCYINDEDCIKNHYKKHNINSYIIFVFDSIKSDWCGRVRVKIPVAVFSSYKLAKQYVNDYGGEIYNMNDNYDKDWDEKLEYKFPLY